MKHWIKKSLLGLTVGLAVLSVSAAPYEVPGSGDDIPKNGTGTGGGNGLSASDDFTRLQNVINAWNSANPSQPLPTPVSTGSDSLSSADVTGTGLKGFAYAVVHYGAGTGGTQGSGGGVEIWYLNGAASFDFPANGSGPNGNGGFSGLVLFEGTPVNVPETGLTAGLLAAACGILGVGRRLVRTPS